MKRVIIAGWVPSSLIDALVTQGVEIERRVEVDRVLWASPINPTPIDLHPNDNWRGKGKRKKRFK